MHGRGKSDSSVVPGKSPNKAGPSAVAEAMEGRGLAKGNAVGADARRTQSRERATSGLERVRQAAKKDRKQRFTLVTRGCDADIRGNPGGWFGSSDTSAIPDRPSGWPPSPKAGADAVVPLVRI